MTAKGDRTIGFVLVSEDGSHYWGGNGMRRWGNVFPVGIPIFPDLASAKQEARRLRERLNLRAVPMRLRIV